MSDLLDVFDRHRRLLFSVAYQMLGSVADAEDAVQDAWLRWSAGDRDDVMAARAQALGKGRAEAAGGAGHDGKFLVSVAHASPLATARAPPQAVNGRRCRVTRSAAGAHAPTG